MADEEFQESEVLFPEINADPEPDEGVEKLADEVEIEKVEFEIEYGFHLKKVDMIDRPDTAVPLNIPNKKNLRFNNNLEKMHGPDMNGKSGKKSVPGTVPNNSVFKNLQKKPGFDMIDKSGGTGRIPVTTPNYLGFKYLGKKPSFFEDEYIDDHGERVPPHLIISKRIAKNVMAFSMCMGYGRTLKGRDLFQVRNSVLRMTGFIEAGF